MALQKINWTQIDSITVPSGYTVDIGKIDGPIDAIYSEKIYLSGTSISDLYLNGGSFSQGVLTLTSDSGNTITVTGFEYGFDRHTTGFTYSNNTFTLFDSSGYTLTASIDILTGLTINGNLIVTGDTFLNNLTASTITSPIISGGSFYGYGNDLIELNGKIGVNVLPSSYEFDVNGTSRFSDTVQLDTVNIGPDDIKILTLSSGNTIQYRSINDFSGFTGPISDTYVTGGTYYSQDGLIIFTNNTGGTFNTTGFTKYFILDYAPTGHTLVDGDRWFNTKNGIELVWVDDGNSKQWVQPSTVVPLGVFLTGGTVSGNTLILTNNNGETILVTGLTANNTYITGFTYDNNTLTILDNSGSTFSVTINELSGLTVNGTLSATTISGVTLYGDGSNLTNVQNIYNSDGFLQSNRTLNLSGKTLTIKQDSIGVTETLLNFVDGSNRDLFQIRSQYFLDTNTFDPYTGNSSSIYIGLNAGASATGVSLNTVVGSNALRSLVSGGNGQVAIGSDALRGLTGGCCNVGVGDMAGGSLVSGSDNIFIGQRSARLFTGGTANVFIGANVVDRATSGTSNVMIGKTAGNNVVGDNNVMIGREAGGSATPRNSSGNVFLGFNAGRSETGSNLLYIENSSSVTPLIYGDFANDLLRFNAKVGVNVLNSTYQFDVNGTSRFSNTVQLDTVNSGITDTKILTLSSGNVVQYRTLSDILSPVTADTYVTGFTYTNNTFKILDNSGSTFTATINEVTGLTINGNLTVTGNTNLNGLSLNNLSANTISATTISGGTFYGDGTNLIGVPKYYAENSTPPILPPSATGKNSISIGFNADAPSSESLVFGTDAGRNSISSSGSTWIGYQAGYEAIESPHSNFIGYQAGWFASPGAYNNSIGYGAGSAGVSTVFLSSFSNLIGYQAGKSFGSNAIGDNNIIIGTNISLPSLVTNSMNIGGVLFGINTYSNTGTTPSVVPTTNGKIGIGVVTPLNRLHVEDTTNPVRFVGLQNVTSDTRILTSDNNGVIRYRNLNDITSNYLPLSGGTLTGDVIFQSGITATTISGGSYYGVGSNKQVIYNNNGILSGSTGFTYNGTNVGIGIESPTNLLHITGSTDPVRIQGLQLSNDNNIVTVDSNGVLHYSPYSGLTVDKWISGGSFDNRYNVLYLGYNTGGGFRVFLNITGLTGTTSVSGNFLPLSGGTVTGDVTFQSGITATIISASTYLNLPIDIYTTGFTFNTSNYDLTIERNGGLPPLIQNLSILATDLLVTGGTYNLNTGVATFTNNSGGTFQVSGFLTGYTDTIITAFTYNNNKFTINDSKGSEFSATIDNVTGLTINGDLNVTGNTIFQGGITANTLSINTIGSSGDCVNDLYVSNIHSCSPLNINPLGEGDVIFGSNAIFQSAITANTIFALTYLNLPIDVFTGGTVSGTTTFTNGLISNTISATTISGGTLYGDGSNLTNVKNIYNNDGFLSANRTLDLSGSTLTIQGSLSSNRFFANGRVGVGTTSDGGFQFDVNGTSRFNGNTTFGSTINGFNLANSYLAFRGTGTSGYGLAFIPFNTINTPNQNISAVSIMDSTFGLIGYTSGDNTFNNLGISPVINTPGGTNLIRGIYFNPILSGLTGTTIVGFQNTVGNNLFNSTSGNTLIGTTVDSGNKLFVSGTTDPVRFENLSTVASDTFLITSNSSGVLRELGGNVANRIPFFNSSSAITTSSEFVFNGTDVSLPIGAGGVTFGNGRARIYTPGIPSGLIFETATSQTGVPDTSKSFIFRNKTNNNQLILDHENTTLPRARVYGQLEVTNTGSQMQKNFWGRSGILTRVLSASVADINSTGGSYTDLVANSFATPTFSATTGGNYTSLTNVYIDGAPSVSANMSGQTLALKVNSGNILFGGLSSTSTDTRILTSNNDGLISYRNLSSALAYSTTGITVSSQTLTTSFNYYGVNYNGNVDLTLPNPSGYDGYNFTIKDEGGYAATHRIRLIPSSGLIDGNNYVDINLRYVALHLMARDNNWWII